jgi:hypothetical protein
MYVNDQASGIWAVEVLSIDKTRLGTAPDVWLGGLTGLMRTHDGFVALQNGILPNRIVNLHLDIKGENVAAMETVESNHPLFEAPMPGTLSGRDLLYVPNSQLNLVDPKTGGFPLERGKETVVLRLPL